jgi:uncharacterized repeat protein (TIGR01451 family)/MYXO-CTERM domain-containing protein
MRLRSLVIFGLSTIALPSIAAADEFAPGSLIIPMDLDYQDMGMLRAYGLVYELLRQNVPVRWVIKTGKQKGDVDFTASATDLLSGAAVDGHGYRGGPWVVDAADAAEALPIVEAWQTDNPETAVHEATGAFTGDVARLLIVAPTIAMMADGNQKIARKYMMAAGIPDSVGDPGWPDSSPDMLDPAEIAGPDTINNHHDGALFDEDADPVYCQFMSMHWAVGDAVKNPDVVAEMRDFLTYPTHLFAECQAVNAFENLAPHGFFLTQKGFLFAKQPAVYDFSQQDTPFAQLDGDFMSVGGSEPAYSLPPGEMYKGSDVVMITEGGTPIGVNDVWMTGFLDGLCPGIEEQPGLSTACLTAGKISYLGGHEYDVDLPISTSPTTQGVRLFLNSLFEAPCATAEGLPQIVVTKTAPAVTDAAEVTFDIEYMNTGPMPALGAVLTDTLPPGVTFVSATDNGAEAGGVVTWQLGNLGEGEGGTVHVTVDLGAPGIYTNTAVVSYRAGVNDLSAESNQTMTAFGVDPGTGTGTGGGGSGTGTGGATGTGGTSDTVPTSDGGGSEASAGTQDASGSSGDTAGETSAEGCGCRSDASGAIGVLGVLGVLGLRRRRSSAGV